MGSFKRFNLEIQYTIVFTIGVVNFETFQRTPTFFQLYGTNCLK